MAEMIEVWEWSRYTHQQLVDMINELRNHILFLEKEIADLKDG